MKANDYAILTRCVEEGVAHGWRRAHKHTDKPEKEHLLTAIENAILSEISEYFYFNEADTGTTGTE